MNIGCDSVPLSEMTTLRVGGHARSCFSARSEEDIIAAVRAAGEENLLIVAGGSNLLVADEGFDGRVVRIESRGLELHGTRVTAAAGEPWDAVVQAAVESGLAGLECLSGIPGSAGATPIQNVGAYEQQVEDSIVLVRAYDRRTERVVALSRDDCDFGYRTSRFRENDDHVVLSVSFDLEPSALSQPLKHRDVTSYLHVEPGTRVPLAAAREAVRAVRRDKGMLIEAGNPDSESISAGSFFKNLLLSPAEGSAFEARYGIRSESIEDDGRHKFSAAKLILAAGFDKGYSQGGPARLSHKHVLALVNGGGATAAQLIALAREVRDVVRAKFGVELLPEPTLVGLSL